MSKKKLSDLSVVGMLEEDETLENESNDTSGIILMTEPDSISRDGMDVIINSERNKIIDTMENSAEICAEMIERQYTNDMHMLDSLAIQLSESFDDNPELAVERMASFAERYNMKRVAFSYPDGVTLTTDGSELNMKGGENFEKALLGERVLSGVIVDRADGKLINVYSSLILLYF